MRVTNWFYKIALFLACSPLLLFSTASFALSCVYDTKVQFKAADLVVAVKVLQTNSVTDPERKIPMTVAVAKVQIEKLFKGTVETSVPLSINLMQIYSVPELTEQKQYIIFSRKNPKSGEYGITECSLYYELTKSMQDYEELLLLQNSTSR